MISLPLMNNLCKRWTLPEHIKEKCDLYFLRNYADSEFAKLIHVKDTHLVIREFGVDFEVIFQHGAERVYTKCGELEKRNEPNDVKYWLSFRSITFNWNGKDCTKSYVLVQVDKGQKKEVKAPVYAAPPVVSSKESAAESLVIGMEWQKTFGIDHQLSLEEFTREFKRRRQLEKQLTHAINYEYGSKKFYTFAEKSLGAEKDE